MGNRSVDLRLLGPVRAWRDGVEITLGSARRMAVLCVLALRTEHGVSREQLVAALWGEDAPASATGNIYTYVSTLRQALEPARGRWAAGQLLSSGGGSYRLHLPPESVDVVRFESLREAARRHRVAGNSLAELASVESALGLWHGEALAGVPGPFAEAQRLRLTELRLATTERYATLLVDVGRHEEAVPVLRRLVDAQPRREDLRTMLADARRAGGPGAAPVVGPTTVPPPDGAAPAAGNGPPARATLIGRDAELRRLRRAVAEAGLGHGRSIRVDGAPGTGKSALLGAALSGAGTAGCRIGWAVGDEVTRHLPLGTLVECIESALADDTARHLVEDATRQLADGPPADADDGISAETVDRVVELVRHAAEASPLVLVVDDLQWADPATLRVWAALGKHAAELPLLLVAAARSGAADVRGLPADEVVELAPLDTAAATALVRAVAPEPPDTERLARILDDAGGHPGYLRHLAVSEPRAPTASALVAAVEAHLAPATEETRQALRALAFLSAYELRAPGTQPAGATLAALAAATDRTQDDLARMLAPALADRVLTTEGDRLLFRHRVVARTLHESTPAALRITLHRSFGQRLVAADAPAEQVVAQLLAGEVPLDGRFGAWLAEHVEELVDRAPQTALAVLRQAHVRYALDPTQRLLLTAWLARLLLRQQQVATAEAGWVAARTTDPALRGEMRWVAAHTHERRGEYEAAAEIAHAALRERRITARWMHQLRTLLARVRPHLPGQPTMPHIPRSTVVDDAAAPTRSAADVGE
ncbi:AAA family ATPase [Polymorphospora rubra]|uniref:AAA family ATPase n=1 Tax=Polymorphospora rubra TaxID=338584 RepID=UPI0033E8B798